MKTTPTSTAATTVLGTCHHDCPDSCGWVATIEDERVVTLRGNPAHPFSRGELCPKVNKFVDRLYNPDRILHPLIRTGAKGEGKFRRASWDEALGLVVDRVRAARTKFGGETICPWFSAGTQGMIQQSSMDRAFFAKLGSSRQVDSVCGLAAGVGMAATYGQGGKGADPLNLVHAELVILWGTNTRMTNRHLWPFVEEARAKGAKIVCIDPLRTITADAADWFIQPLPGTDAAIMLAMMHVLIAEDSDEGYLDHDYIEAHAVGFDELVAHVAAWTPERAAEISGVSASEIRQLARAYGRAKPAFIRTLIGAEHHENGAMFYRTLACLPILTGSWRHLGGGVARSVGSWQEAHNVDLSVYDAPHLADGASRRSLSQNRIGETLTDPLLDPPVTVFFAWNGNPLVTIPNAAATRAGLEREDLFTVVSEQFMTDTARYADVIFPATTQLEHTDVVPSWGHLWLGWNEGAVEPEGEAVPNTELFRRLAKAFGFTDPEFDRTDDELIEMALLDVDVDELRSQGFVRISDTDNLMPYAEGGFATASGKAELCNPSLASLGLPIVPDYVPPVERVGGGADDRYPLVLSTPKNQVRFLNSSYSGLSGHGDREGGPFVELCPTDADSRGLGPDDVARVFNDRASLELPVRISNRVRPGLVAIPWGWWSRDHPDGITVNALTSAASTGFGIGAAYGDTIVEVESAR